MSTILVADDNSNIQKMVTLALKDEGIRVAAVGNGEAAVRKLSEVSPDLILADIFMPVRNGYEVCEFVKQDSRFSHIPVILLVGAFDPFDEREAQRVGADGVLKKPFVPPDPLVSMVKAVLARAGGNSFSSVMSGGPGPASPDTTEQEIEAVHQPPPAPIEEFPSPGSEAPYNAIPAPVAEAEPEPEPEEASKSGEGYVDLNAWRATDTAKEPQSSGWRGPDTFLSQMEEEAFPKAPVEEPPAEEPPVVEVSAVEEPEPAVNAPEAPTTDSGKFNLESLLEEIPEVAPPSASAIVPPAYIEETRPEIEPAAEGFPVETAEGAPEPPARSAQPEPWATTPPPEPEPEPSSSPVAEVPPSASHWAEAAAQEAAAALSSASSGASQPPSAEMIDAVVAKVLERMQPQVLEIVMREVLRPVVEAVVRRELEKD